MRKAFLAAITTAALMNGCTTTPYGYASGSPAYRDDDGRFVRRADPYPAGRDGYRDPRAGGERRYGRDRGRPRDRYDDDCRQSDDPHDCPPPRMAMPEEHVQPLPPNYPDDDSYVGRRPAPAATAQGGEWRAQLGAFRQQPRAAALRASIADLPALSTYRTYLVIGGGVTRVQAGPLPTAAAAGRLCARIKAGGHACIVKAA